MSAPASDLHRDDDAESADFTARAHAFARIHAGTDMALYANNLRTRVELVASGAIAMPVTINDAEPGNAWICSPRTTYADYATEETARAGPAWLAPPSRCLGAGLGHWLDHARIDRAVAVNNWLVTTNLYPRLQSVPLATVVADVRARWPTHAVWFRSLNGIDNADWIAALQDLGFTLLPSRQVYLCKDVAANVARHTDLKRDMQLLRTASLQRAGEIVDSDYDRIAELYGLLYMRKYSRCNPDYTPAFMRAWHRAGLVVFDGLRNADGVLQCVAGVFRQGSTLTSPLFGYDTAQPQSVGLYRLLNACVFDIAIRQGMDLHLSAGAPTFKRTRGGVPAIEYSAVDARHMPRATRFAVAALATLTRRVGVPIMQRFAL